jgi:hypothetical protein|tara:strand:+ start:535 stop:870 length:336 start_codon:yes stop_codon:yes gene_type:complete
MKMYNNGQRPTKMYGGGMTTPRKPMQMGGLAQQNRKQAQPMAKNMGMGMTEQKKYGMGMNLGGAIKKFEGRQKAALGVKAAKPDFLDLDKDGDTTEPMKTAAKSAKKGKMA